MKIPCRDVSICLKLVILSLLYTVGKKRIKTVHESAKYSLYKTTGETFIKGTDLPWTCCHKGSIIEM